MISLQGLSSLVGLSLVDATRERQIESIKNSAQGTREINAFRERIGSIETVDQLLDDHELYTFVMKAYDLEDQIFGKALMAKVFKSDADDDTSLVNRLTSQKFKDIHEGLGFLADGIGNNNTLQPAWQEEMVERFLDRQFINMQTDQNETIGTVLEFRKLAGTISSPFDFLKNAILSEFIQTAVGIPSEAAGLDIDILAALIEDRVDIENLDDPKEVNKLVLRYIAIKDAENTANISENIAVQLMSAAVNASSGGQFVPITLDIESIILTPRGAYS
ncbi:MAG: hypothetical protein COB84_03255 [Rhodobacteraceae bacterium]|nr:MAG: hypothetical protein COB84_03255 [Paracoccaceae bacterium]